MKPKTQSGQSAVEFALVLPLLLILLMGIMEFGLVLYDKAVITNAAREGARAGIVYLDPSNWKTDSDITTVVNNYCKAYLVTFSSNNPVIACQRTGTSPYTNNNTLTVTVTYNYGWLVLPGFITSLVNPLHLGATSTMKFE